MKLRVAFVLPFGEPREGFLPDALLAQLAAEARAAGHQASLVRVYYDGRDRMRDRDVARKLEAWLDRQRADLVVFDRLFDPGPIQAHLGRDPRRRSVLVTRGDSFDPIDGVSLVIGANTQPTRSGGTRRSPPVPEVAHAFRCLLDALDSGAEPGQVVGVDRIVGGDIVQGAPLAVGAPPVHWQPALDWETISLATPPPVTRKTLFGNVGCPYANDPLEAPLYAELSLPTDRPIARLGCAFCAMGGDYEKRPNDVVVAELVEQASWYARSAPEVTELVLNDQYATPYLAALLREATRAGVPPRRWLFAARADTFVRERSRIEDAVTVAAETGHVLETHLSGFESFCDRELERYNKGATVADLVAGVKAMRALAARHPRSFAYADARGHSLLFWSPWTTPEDLGESVGTIRREGLTELFHELGRNRLRLYRNLPIYYAAERDGALVDAWQDEDEGAGRRKGYNVEAPWRFLDPRTRLAHTLAGALREALGSESEVAQLGATVAFARETRSVEPRLGKAQLLRDLTELWRALDALGPERIVGAPPRGASERCTPVLFAGACNNACATCAQRDRWLDDDSAALRARIDTARLESRAIVLAGREPTVHPAFTTLVLRACGWDARRVGVVSNGRRFADTSFTRAAIGAGLTSASIKIFAPDDARADAISGIAGAHAEALAGVAALADSGRVAVELRVPPHHTTVRDLERYADLAMRLRVRQLRIEVALDAIGLDGIARAADGITRLASACASRSIALETSQLRSATRAFEWIPAPRPSGPAPR